MAARRTLSSLQAAHQHLISNISRQDTAAAGQQAGGMRAGLWEPGLVVEEMSWVLRILVMKLCVCVHLEVCVRMRARRRRPHAHAHSRLRACACVHIYMCVCLHPGGGLRCGLSVCEAALENEKMRSGRAAT